MIKTFYQQAVDALVSGNYEVIDRMVDRLRRHGDAELFARILEGCCIGENCEFLASVDLVVPRRRQAAADYAALQLIGYAPDPSLLDPSIDRSRIRVLRIMDHSLNKRHQYRMARFPDGILRFKGLQQLDMEEARIGRLPDGFGSLTSLETLVLSSNPLVELPGSIGELSALRYLNLNGTLLESLPPGLGRLGRLETLELSGNLLQSLPDDIGDLPALRTLRLGAGLLKELPAAVTRIQSLHSLDLSGCDLEVLPESIRSLKDLEILVLDRNRRFRWLPRGLTELPKLQRLSLRSIDKPIPRPGSRDLCGQELHDYLNKVRRQFGLETIKASPSNQVAENDLECPTPPLPPPPMKAIVPHPLRSLLPMLLSLDPAAERLGLELLKTLENEHFVRFVLGLFRVEEGRSVFHHDNPHGFHLPDAKALRLLYGLMATFQALPTCSGFDPGDILETELDNESAHTAGLLEKMTGLRKLKLWLGGTPVPNGLTHCTALGHLTINAMARHSMPDPSAHPALKRLSFSDLSKRPSLRISGYDQLNYLDIHKSKVVDIEIDGLPMIHELSITRSQTESLSIRNCPRLSQLTLESVVDFQHLEIEGCPRLSCIHVRFINSQPILLVIPGLQGLNELEMGSLALEELPDCITGLTQLRRLGLPRNRLATLPDALSGLSSLEYLNLSGNCFVTFPKPILTLPNLETLDISYNKLEALPSGIGRMTSLLDLRVNQNRLRSIPESIGSLPHLMNLELGQQNDHSFTDKELPRGLFEKEIPVRLNVFCDVLTKRRIDALRRAGRHKAVVKSALLKQIIDALWMSRQATESRSADV